MKKMNHPLVLNLLVAAAFLGSSSAFAATNATCPIAGSYGYIYGGTANTAPGQVSMKETGFFNVNGTGNFNGEGTLVFSYSDFAGNGPVWLLINEKDVGTVTQGTGNTCAGTVQFSATGTVVNSSSPLVPVGTVLYNNSPRSMAYTASAKGTTIDMVSTSPGTVASGTAQKQ